MHYICTVLVTHLTLSVQLVPMGLAQSIDAQTRLAMSSCFSAISARVQCLSGMT